MKKYAIITIALIQKCLIGLKKILKHNSGEKSLKASFVIYLDFIKKCLLKKRTILNPKYLTQKKKLDMSPLIGQCLQDIHLIKKKMNLIIKEEKN